LIKPETGQGRGVTHGFRKEPRFGSRRNAGRESHRVGREGMPMRAERKMQRNGCGTVWGKQGVAGDPVREAFWEERRLVGNGGGLQDLSQEAGKTWPRLGARHKRRQGAIVPLKGNRETKKCLGRARMKARSR